MFSLLSEMLLPVNRRLKSPLLTVALSSPLLTHQSLITGCLLRSSLASGVSTDSVLYLENDGVVFSIADGLACHRETRRTILTRCSFCLFRYRCSNLSSADLKSSSFAAHSSAWLQTMQALNTTKNSCSCAANHNRTTKNRRIFAHAKMKE